MKVLLLYSLAPDGNPGEFDLTGAAAGLREAIPDAHVAGVKGEIREVLNVLDRERPDVVWNLCEAPLGRPDREAHLAALLEWLNIPFTGSGSEALALCRRKDLTNAILENSGVRTAGPANGFPCFVKPAAEDGSGGIDSDCICFDAAAVRRMQERLARPTIVENYLPGREFCVNLWGHQEPTWQSISETLFQNGCQVITYRGKWELDSADYLNTPITYAPIEQPLRTAMLDLCGRAWKAVGLRGYASMNVRLNAAGEPCIIDVNPNPEITPEVGIYRAVIEAGWTFRQFVDKQLEWALAAAR